MSEVLIKETKQEAEIKAKQTPDPTGFHLLAMVPKLDGTWGGKLAKPDETVRVEEQTSVVLFIAKVGPDAYKDRTRFPGGPWCKPGDFVICRAYAGTRLKIHGTEWRLLNDDSIEAVVEDPRGISRAG